MPAPLTPAGLDLRDFSWMPLDVVRLRDSNLVVIASAEAFRAAVMLWCASWHQVPAASLPDDDRLLANLAGFGRDVKAWKAVRDDALHGFVMCDDGRLYHPVIAEKAVEADDKRRVQRERTAAATRARRRVNRDGPPDGLPGEDRHDQRDDQRNDHQGTRPDRRGPDIPSSPSLRSVEGESARAPVGRIDAIWVPSDDTLVTLERDGFHPTQTAAEVPKFRAHFRGTGEIRADWDAAFEKWMLDGRQRGLIAPGPSQTSSAIHQAKPGDPEWDAWKAHYTDMGARFRLKCMNESTEQGKPHTFPSQWPPGHPGTGGEPATQVAIPDSVPPSPIKTDVFPDFPDYLRRKVG